MTISGTDPGVSDLSAADREAVDVPCPDPLGRGVLVGLGAFFLALIFVQALA